MRRTPLARKTPPRPGQVRMRRSRSTGKPTVSQEARLKKVKDMPCLACWINRERGHFDHCHWWRTPDIHHLLSGGRRIGHDATIPLCPWHHRSQPPVDGMGIEGALVVYGPTLERQKAFRDYYGTDAELLALTDSMLGAKR